MQGITTTDTRYSFTPGGITTAGGIECSLPICLFRRLFCNQRDAAETFL